MLAPALLIGTFGIAPVSASFAQNAEPETETMEERLKEKLHDFLDKMGPALDEALDETLEFFGAFGAVDDPRHYEMPEILPNGDIIIRRRPDAPDYEAPQPPAPTGEIDTIDL